jgi:uncharacterized protein YihD (DUF1040 family)
MSRLSATLGEKYQNKRASIFTRTFEYGGHTFKVKIPSIAEADAIYQKVMNPPDDLVETLYTKMAEPLLKFKDSASPEDEVEYLDDDVIVKHRSMREAAKNKAMTEAKITEYIKLLVPENPENTMDDITYADVEAEFPLPIQLSLVEKIAEVISPSYKESRGN